MTEEPQYRLDVTTSDGKYTVRQMMDGSSIALQYGKAWPAYEGRELSNLELALAYELAETREKLAKAEANYQSAVHGRKDMRDGLRFHRGKAMELDGVLKQTSPIETLAIAIYESRARTEKYGFRPWADLPVDARTKWMMVAEGVAAIARVDADEPATRPLHTFQVAVHRWCIECFGPTTAYDTTERNWRFLEEAMELVQSLGGNAEDAHKLVDYVFGRPAGEPHQELGGTMVTLAALASASNLSIEGNAFAELDRIERPEIMNRIRAKHAAKPHKSSLPGDYRHPEPGTLVVGKANRP